VTVLRDELQRTLGGAYTLERELGGGGMSSVFVARDNALGRTVVVKVLPYELAATVSVDRFKREIMLSAALQHPHIVPVLSAGETGSDDKDASGQRLPFFIMPFVEGESLRARLSRGPLSVREAVSILKDVSRALVYAHGRGIIHRDIKPDNILLSGGSATVTDFGVAKAITASREGARPQPPTRSGTITMVGTSIGTPAYMAPEQAAGDPNTDHRADLYALGIVGYEMLVGTPPFHGRAPQQLLAAQLTEPPPPIASRRYDVPGALATLIMRLLEKDPSKRPRAAAEVARALEDPAVVSGTFISAAPPKKSQPKRVVWALAGAGILASVAAGGAWFTNHRAPASTAGNVAAPAAVASKSVAVMPLVNISRDTSDAYFAAGMTAEITNALSRIPGLRVASGNESAARDKAATPTDIGKSLNVNMVLFGTVQRDKSRLRVTARLVNSADGFTIWSDMFERDSKDVFKVQDDISNAIVAAISPELSAAATAAAPVATVAAAAPAANHGTSDLQAYDLYLRGRYFFEKRGEAGLRRALDYFQQAADKDSMFARAYAGIANVYALLPLYANVRVDSLMPLALKAINRSVGLDSTLAEAFASRASLLQASWRWPEAERDYLRALKLDPNYAAAHQWLGEMLLLNGRTADGMSRLKRATELDPLSPISFGSYALALAVGRNPDAAIAAGRRAVELDSTLLVTRFMLGGVYLQANRLPEAIRELEAASRLDSTSTQTLGLLAFAYAKSGNTKRAGDLAKSLEASVGRLSGASAAAARAYIGLGDNGRALTLLERAVNDHDSFFSSESLAERFFDPLRADPRFAGIVAKAGLDKRLLARQ
jgi:serine/threonine protein kinase/TolB-like protein/Tfp pilus assembly protein PilF